MGSLVTYHRCLDWLLLISRWPTVGEFRQYYLLVSVRMVGMLARWNMVGHAVVFSRVPGCVVHVQSLWGFLLPFERKWIGLVFDQCEWSQRWILFDQWVCRLLKEVYHLWYFGINVVDVLYVDNSRDLFADLSQIEGVFTFMLLLDELRTLPFNLIFWSLRLYLGT
jgi:hypothetical protein